MENYIDKFTKLIMDARKEKRNNEAEVLKLIKAKLIEFTTQKNAPELNKQAFIDIIKKMCKELNGDIDIAKSANRQDLVDKYTFELNTFSEFVPKEATENEINNFLDKVSLEFIQKNMGAIIKLVKNNFDSVDGSLVAKLVKSRIK